MRLHYQPIADLRTGRCERVEALLRWDHPRIGPISPDELLPLASRARLSAEIDRWALAHAVSQARLWREESVPLSVGVNVSLHDLTVEAIDVLANLLRERTLHARDFIFEISAAELSYLSAHATQVLGVLVAGGFRVAMDRASAAHPPRRVLATYLDDVKIARSLVARISIRFHSSRRAPDLGAAGPRDRAHADRNWHRDAPTYDRVVDLGYVLGQGYEVSRRLAAG